MTIWADSGTVTRDAVITEYPNTQAGCVHMLGIIRLLIRTGHLMPSCDGVHADSFTGAYSDV